MGASPEPAAGATGRIVGNVLGGLGLVAMSSEGAAQEGVRSMQAGTAPNRARAAANAVAEASLVPAVIRSVEYGGNLRDNHVAEAERYHGRGLNAELTGRAMALREFAGDLTGLNPGSRIAQEEILREERQAAREGREPDYRRSTLNGMARGLGEVLLINTIARSANSVTPEEVAWQGQQQVLQAWVQRKANEALKEINSIKASLQRMAAHGNPDGPKFRQQLIDLSRRYDKARAALTKLSHMTGRQLGEADPLTQSVRVRVAKLPAMSSHYDIRKVLSQTVPAAPTSNSGTDAPQGGEEDDPDDTWDEPTTSSPPHDDSRYYEQVPHYEQFPQVSGSWTEPEVDLEDEFQNPPEDSSQDMRQMPPSSHGPKCDCPECKGKTAGNDVPAGIVMNGPAEEMQNVADVEDPVDADEQDEADESDDAEEMHADEGANSDDVDDADDVDDEPADDMDADDEPVHHEE